MSKAPLQAIERFKAARFGMFIHYGLYSQLGRREWAMHYERIPAKEYATLADQFNPTKLDVSDWLHLAKATGMQYACLTTRHHDGFCLFDTATTDFNSVKTAAHRDLVHEFVDACRAHDILPCLYYSVANWSDPAWVAGPAGDPSGWQRFVEEAHAQLRELMTNYGDITYLFYDGCPPPEAWRGTEINAEIRGLQPDILISNRCQLEEDVESAENHLISDPGNVWECCMTMNESWGYNAGDPLWKTAHQLVQKMMACVHDGGNFMLNIGPRGDGSLEAAALERLKVIGGWMQRNAEFLAATTPHPFNYADRKLSASHDNTAYFGLHFYGGADTVIGGIANRVLAVSVLGTDESVAFRQEADRLFVDGLPARSPDPVFTVLKIVLDGEPRTVPHPLDNAPGKFEF